MGILAFCVWYNQRMIHVHIPNNDNAKGDSSFSAIDFDFPSTGMNVSEITLNSRYPETGFALNKKSEMIVRVLEGSVLFCCEVEEVELSVGATVLVETNKKYFWEPRDSVTLYIVSNPPWTKEQAENVE